MRSTEVTDGPYFKKFLDYEKLGRQPIDKHRWMVA